MIDSLAWDPEMESPATIAILGAGPLGIEAALYARFLGYHVSIFETRRVAHRMLDWNLRPLEEPAGKITTSLGLSALQAQDPTYIPPEPSRIFNGKQYAEEYLLPLAKTDLLFDDIHFLSPVIDISRFRVASQPVAGRFDEYPWQERCNDEFRILVEGRHRGTWVSRADCIIDCREIEPLVSGSVLPADWPSVNPKLAKRFSNICPATGNSIRNSTMPNRSSSQARRRMLAGLSASASSTLAMNGSYGFCPQFKAMSLNFLPKRGWNCPKEPHRVL